MRGPPSIPWWSAILEPAERGAGAPRRRRRRAVAARRRPRHRSAVSASKAIVTAIHDGGADLDVRGKRMRASVRDLRVSSPAPAAAARSTSTWSCSRARAALADLNVIGCTVDEAIARAQRFLDESLLTRPACRSPHSRVRNRTVETGAHRVSAAASARRAFRAGAARAGRRWRHGGGVERVTSEICELGIRNLKCLNGMLVSPAVHRRPSPAGQHRAGGAGLRAAAPRRHDVQGPLPVPFREDAVVPRRPGKGVLSLFRL